MLDQSVTEMLQHGENELRSVSLQVKQFQKISSRQSNRLADLSPIEIMPMKLLLDIQTDMVVKQIWLT